MMNMLQLLADSMLLPDCTTTITIEELSMLHFRAAGAGHDFPCSCASWNLRDAVAPGSGTDSWETASPMLCWCHGEGKGCLTQMLRVVNGSGRGEESV